MTLLNNLIIALLDALTDKWTVRTHESAWTRSKNLGFHFYLICHSLIA